MPRLLNRHHYKNKPLPVGARYIGRGTPYGNPFVIGKDGNRQECVDKFEREVLPDLDVEPLRGFDLICSCYPLPCHGEPIMRKLYGSLWRNEE